MGQARRERRAYEKWLKKNDPAAYAEWKAGAHERGREIHAENRRAVEQTITEHYERQQALLEAQWRAKGLSEKEIEAKLEAWFLTVDPL